MAERYYGEIPGVPSGTTFTSRTETRSAGVHLPLQAGISGTKSDGADSIVVNGGYEDDEDFGTEIIYTGAGANDPATGKQIRDQEIAQPGIAGLITSHLEGLPVRVVRGFAGDPAYSPPTGYRYDGLFRVAEHWSESGRSGFRVWRFRLVALDPQERASYTPDENLPSGNTTPGTSRGVVTRIIRSTRVSDAVKHLYSGACQVCDVVLDVPGGVAAEGAHIRALGGKHAGPDVPENVLCLCPNHHTLFDLGGIYIDDQLEVHDHRGHLLGPLTRHRQHIVSVVHLRYHRDLWRH